MKIFAIICTRDKNLKSITTTLVNILSSYGVDVKLLVNQSSIFSAYAKGIKICKAGPDDIFILCHDDLEILSTKEEFIAALAICSFKETGIVGPAGTTDLGKNAVWWDHERWHRGKHRGMVNHRKPNFHTTEYGPYGQVVVLDGLFLAARKEVWEHVTLDQPEFFEGNWDFYDILYTTRAHILGYKNCAVPIKLVHDSSGEVDGRESWHKNREAFIHNNKLPITC